jgi:O-antigen/teichoic acid export membrane protein
VAQPVAEPAQAAVDVATEKAMRGLFGRDSIYLVVWAAQVGFAALSIPINTRLLGSYQFGLVTTALAVMQILVTIGVFSLPIAVQRAFRPGHDRDSRRIITLSVFTAGITFVVAAGTGPQWASLLSLGPYSGALRYAVIWAALTAVTFAALALLRSREQLIGFGIVSLLQSAVAEVFSVLLVVFVRHSAAEFILGELIAQAVALAVAVYLTRPLPILRRHLSMVADALRFSSALVPAAVAGFMLVTVDRIVIRADLPIDQVARYGAIYNVAAIPVLLLGVLDTVWMPRFFALEDHGTRSALFADSRDATAALLIPMVLALSIGAPLVLLFWVPASYDPAGLWLPIATIAASGFPVAAQIAARRVLLIAGSTWPLGLSVVVAALFNVALNIAIVPSMGIEGAALATLLAYVLLHWLVLFFSRRVEVLRRAPVRLVASCWLSVAVGLASTALPAHGAFAIARLAATVVCGLVFTAMLLRIVAPEKAPAWLREAAWARRA